MFLMCLCCHIMANKDIYIYISITSGIRCQQLHMVIADFTVEKLTAPLDPLWGQVNLFCILQDSLSSDSVLSYDFSILWLTRCSAIAERARCRVRYSSRQKKKTGTGRQYFTDIIGLSSTSDIIGLTICRIRRKKPKIRAITAFKVIQGHRGRYQSKARMRFPISD